MRLHALVSSLPPDWKPRTAPFPAVCRVAEARQALEAGGTWRDMPLLQLPPVALGQLRQRLVVCHQSGDWSDLAPRDWRYAAECLTLGEPRLIDQGDFVAAFLAALAARWSGPGSANLLARWYVRNFAISHPGVAQIGAALAGHRQHMGAGWGGLHDRFALFDPGQTVAALAGVLGAADTVPVEALRRLRCPSSLLSSRLFGHVFVAVCHNVAAGSPRSLDWIKGLSDWAFGSNNQFLHHVIPGAQAAYAEALLRPWATRFPGEEIRSLVVPQLLGLMMDPRTNPAGWADVSATARQVMLGWMIKDALEQFLEVVDETVQSHQTRMWAERRQFWLAYYEQNYIHECWVVFGRRGAALARHMAGRKNNPSLMNFGGFVRDVGGDPNQAVLLMKLGRLLVADWSHNARCYIWLPDNPAAPPLYQNEYLRHDLMSGADFETPHHKNWQENIGNFVSSHMAAARRPSEAAAPTSLR